MFGWLQGEEEGMHPDKALYESLIKHFCREEQLDAALERLMEMQEQGVRPGKDHYSPLVTAHALAGEINGARPKTSSPPGAPCIV